MVKGGLQEINEKEDTRFFFFTLFFPIGILAKKSVRCETRRTRIFNWNRKKWRKHLFAKNICFLKNLQRSETPTTFQDHKILKFEERFQMLKLEPAIKNGLKGIF